MTEPKRFKDTDMYRYMKAQKTGWPMGVSDKLVKEATSRYVEKLDEYPEGRNWLDGDPFYHRNRAMDNIAEVDHAPHLESNSLSPKDLKNYADALNHILMAMDIAINRPEKEE